MSEIQSFAKNVFILDGPAVRALGVSFPTRMIMVKLEDNSLWVNSPVSISDEMLSRITRMGEVRHLVAPTKMHVWRLQEWHALFPNAALWAPPQIPHQFKRLPFAGVLGEDPPSIWANDFDQLVFRGNLFIDEVYFYHKKSRSVVFGDFIQNYAASKDNPLRNALLKVAGVLYPTVSVPIDIRLSFTNRRAARKSLEKLLSWDFDKLIVAHGMCVEEDAKAFVQRAFKWLQE